SEWASRSTSPTPRCSSPAKRAATTPARFCIPTAASRCSESEYSGVAQNDGLRVSRCAADSRRIAYFRTCGWGYCNADAHDNAKDSADSAADAARLRARSADRRLLGVE